MGLYRDEAGRLIEVDDKFADARGYVPAEPTALGSVIREAGDRARAEERGIVGDINAGLTGVASGLTLGLSDVALAHSLTPLERERLQAEIGAHPNLRTGGEIAGAIAGSFVAPGSALAKTPAGYLGVAAGREVEAGLAQGGIRGTAKALNAMGAEGAVQSAGQYIGHNAIEDKETTAEGLAGSLGTGYGFGVAGGAAALGVVKGTMAARRMYSRVMDGRRAAQDAASSWSLASQEALDADAATLRAAETKLENISKAKIEAQRGRNEAAGAYREEKMYAATAEPRVAEDVAPEAFVGPEPLANVAPQSGEGGATQAYRKPEPITFDPAAAQAFDEGLPSMRDQVNAVAGDITPAEKGAKTGAFKRPEGSTARVAREAPPTELESQLAGTKAKLDEGAALKDVKPVKAGKGNDSPSIEGWLEEKKAFDDAELNAARASEDIKGANELRNRRQTTLSEIRYKATEDLLGPQVAKMEQELQDIVDEFKQAKAGLGELSDGVPEPFTSGEAGARRDLERGDPHRGAPWGGGDGPRAAGPDEGSIPVIDVYGIEKGVGRAPRGGGTKVGSPGVRQARQILDDAHEEALLRAKYGADPEEAGQALSHAEELENLLNQIDDVSDGVPRAVDGTPEEMFADQLAADIKKLWRYEESSAKLADAVGEAAHPTSLGKAKAFRDAAKDSERKVMDRSARAVDDAEHFGPEYKTPKERVQYARGNLNEAQKNLDELGVQEKEARAEFQKAGKKVREGEKAKKAATRADATASAKAGKMGAAEAGGLLEFIDLPGLPKPSDLPVIGPLLGAYLKFRTLKKAMGRFMGRVPATADAQVAARAAQTRDRIARAVDRSLGLVERSGKFAARKMPATSAILATRIFDDGGDDPGPKASITKQAAARMREINAYVHTPNAIELDVRRELRGVVDPDLIAAAEKHRRYMIEYIQRVMPKIPDPGLLKTHDWEPSPGQAMSLARTMDALNDPPAVFEKLAQERDLVSLEAAKALRDVYPKLFEEALQRAIARGQEAPQKIPYRTRVQMSVFYGVPFEPALSPENFQVTQSVYDKKPSSPAYNPAMPGAAAPSAPTAQPAIANPVDLSQAYMPSFDRR